MTEYELVEVIDEQGFNRGTLALKVLERGPDWIKVKFKRVVLVCERNSDGEWVVLHIVKRTK